MTAPGNDRGRMLIERSAAAMCTLDDELRYLDVNEAACELLGRPRDELLGRRAGEYLPEDAQRAIEQRFAAIRDEGAARGDWTLSDGTKVEFAVTADVLPGVHFAVFLPVDPHEEPQEADSKALTPREREVLTLVARGLTSEQIAATLGLSGETVRTHARNALAGLGAHTRAHAVALALRQGLIEL